MTPPPPSPLPLSRDTCRVPMTLLSITLLQIHIHARYQPGDFLKVTGSSSAFLQGDGDGRKTSSAENREKQNVVPISRRARRVMP